MVENSNQHPNKRYLHPILGWNTDHVWNYLKAKGLPHCDLYDEGFARIGCVGCPMAGGKRQMADFERWPRFYKMYLKAFDNLLALRKRRGLQNDWKSPEAVMEWWTHENEKKPPNTGQILFFE